MTGELLEKARRFRHKAVEDYRQLHNLAEEGLQLPKTITFCKSRLRELDIPFEEIAGGLVATLGKGEGCILLRADMDALPIEEKTGLEYSSKNGNMHACGHDMHTAMLLLAARLIKEREGELSRRAKLCFQPGEETLEGAKGMIEAGLLEGGVDRAAMLHVLTGCDYERGTLVIPQTGVGAAGADFFRISVLGQGCHGASPHAGIDPMLCASFITSALATVTAREVPAGSGEVLTVGKMESGEVANAVPDTAVLWGTLRSYDEKNRAFIKERLCCICENMAAALRCRAVVDFTSGCPSFLNDPDLVKSCRQLFREWEAPCVVIPEGTRGGGSEDFAYVSRRVPSVMLAMSAGAKKDGYTEPLHSPFAVFDSDAIPYGAAAYAAMAFGL